LGKKRDKIKMSEEETREFLAAAKTLILTSVGSDGFPHSLPMWFARDSDGTIRMTTFAKSQKVLNMRRNPKVTLLAEDGVEYSQLRGVMIKAEVEVVNDVELAIDTMLELAGTDPMLTRAEENSAARDAVRQVAEKRVVLLCKPVRILSFDHRKLGGVY
jgi:nitroimidazol reductase NimA-like FMN-containing flavoprotein (pyridoxamine 5'-phosphate oxidase superfamily)